MLKIHYTKEEWDWLERSVPHLMMKNLKEQLASKVALISAESISTTASTPVVEGSTALAPVNPQPIVDVIPSFTISLQEAKSRVTMLQQFVADMMTAGVDYGNVSGCQKPTLLKPGAEKLCDIFGFSKYVEVTNRLEDWDKGFLHYEIKVTLLNKRTNLVEAEGIGSCNSREKKYAKQDAYSIGNTLLKMAKKRALVDAVLSATRSSGLFTQDIEDMEIAPVISGSAKDRQKVAEVPVVNVMPAHQQPVLKATVAQLKKIFTLAREHGLEADYMKEVLRTAFGVSQSGELTRQQASELIEWLNK